MTSHTVTNQLSPLSLDEMNELDSFLMSDPTSDETMSLDTRDGYLTAILVGPTTLNFNQWFSGIWGPKKEDAPKFKTMEETQHIIDLVIRLINGVISDLEDDPDDIHPSSVPGFILTILANIRMQSCGLWFHVRHRAMPEGLAAVF
jgi:hypothetical protein